MTTPIGTKFADSPCRLTAVILVGLLTVAGDLILVSQHMWYERSVLPLIAIVALVELAKGDLSSLGFNIVPIQGWAFWIRTAIWLGLIIAVVLTAWVWGLLAGGFDLPIVTTLPSSAGIRLWDMCIAAPVLEESIYRFALCVPLTVLLRPWGAIAVSGLAFGLLHLVYGNPSPENAIGGFVLAWTFLKSGSIYLPVLLHSLGNLFVLAAQVGGWYCLCGSG